MKYLTKKVKLANMLAFWKHFQKQECLVFYNPQKEELIFGAKRIRTFADGESHQDYPYVFSTRSFFPMVRDPKWVDFGNETIAFTYYLVEKDGNQTLYYPDQGIDDTEIEEISSIQSSLTHTHTHTCQFGDDYPQWQAMFDKVLKEITLHKATKVVLSREVKITCDGTVDQESVLHNLLKNNRDSFVFAYTRDGKTFLGATPEILVQKEGDTIISYALAGTISRSKLDDEKQQAFLLNDPKNVHEHTIVIDRIAQVLKKYSRDVQIGQTRILALRNLYHLQTILMAKDASPLTEWVTRLHPTPAMGGSPYKTALDIIKRNEKHERGLYAAPLGVINANGDGVFVVGIRSALVIENKVYAYIGCGIVEGSDCREEYLETNEKMRTILESLEESDGNERS
ncbi:isochorismate synthase [Dehalobacter sp. DCM]|uniref:isochorismate synthase n=1 Tax=Dehalobacter sp. DCM TaxID=2907827 RepID=UPI003081F7B6|nr:isochorismate synthase [Dehalobacter sp. DCM]